jgi:predicted TIM-barrel fold metal-dependent hydrolase
MELVDAHQHVGTLEDAVSYQGQPIGQELPVDTDAARRAQMMDAAGVSWAVLQPAHAYLRPDGIRDTMKVNDRMARYRDIAPQRFRAILGTVEPLYGERSIPEIERCKNELKLNGMSWHHRFSGVFIDSKWMWPYLRRMAELNLVPLIHVNVDSSLEAHWRLQRLAREFSNMTFLALDGLWSYERARHVFETAASTPNVIWDIGGPANYIGIEEWVNKNGADTICFSADLAYASGPVEKPKLQVQVEKAKVPDSVKEKVFAGNIYRLFGFSR